MQAEWTNYMSRPPSVRVPRSNKYPLMTWVLYDIDNPTPYDRHLSPFLHYMKSNIACTEDGMQSLCDIGELPGDEVHSYIRPAPSNNIPHSYHIEVFGHIRPCRAQVERENIKASGIANFNLGELKERNEMETLFTGAFMTNGQSRPLPIRVSE